jgi:membrane-associated phospholipid phosphatase
MSTRFYTRAAPLALALTILAGCEPDATSPEPVPAPNVTPAGAPVTLEWQALARSLVGAHRYNALAAARVYAALSVAQQRAVAKAEMDPVGASDVPASSEEAGGRALYEARRGAIAGASLRVLGWFFPDSARAIEQTLVRQGKAGPGGRHPEFTRGAGIGRAEGGLMVAHLQSDGFTTPFTGTVPTGAGYWIPSAMPPGGGTFGGVKPYFLAASSQFRPAAPPAYLSAEFATDLAEVVARTKNITPEELAFARYWDFPLGSPTPIGYWNGAAAEYVDQRRLDERAATQVFALMHAATMDALIACWEAKYHYWYLRPSHADPAISLAFTLPNFPSYPSGHSCASSAAARVLTHFFPDRGGELTGWVNDAGLSRILAGIHYRFDVTAGQALGRSVADWAISRNAF